MRGINQRFVVLVILFAIHTVELHAQRVITSFTPAINTPPDHTIVPQSTDPDQISHLPDSVIAPAERIDGKIQPIAAQVEKKEKLQLLFISRKAWRQYAMPGASIITVTKQ